MNYITVKLTEDQATELCKILGAHLVETEKVAQEYNTTVKPEFTAFIKRVQTKVWQALAKAKNV